MARKVRTQVTVQAQPTMQTIEGTVSVDSSGSVVYKDRVRFKGVDSRRLVTFGPEHEIWDPNYIGTGISVEGAIVRLEPPAGITDAWLDEFQVELKHLGAVAVRVGHRQRADAVITQVEKAQPAKGESVHQVVMGMVEEAKAGDKEALRNLIEAALAAEGL